MKARSEQLFCHLEPKLAHEVKLAAEMEGMSNSAFLRRLLLYWREQYFTDRATAA
jgi:hypothetical protein